MSFGDPNNPYGAPQGGQQPGQPPQAPQPGYGYPQAPQGQPGYGYPSAPPVQPQYGYGMAMGMEMPGLIKTARVLLFILAGFQLLAGVFIGIAAGFAQDISNGVGAGDETSIAAGALIGIAVLVLAIGALSIFLGVKFKTGGSGIRITTIVYASLMLLGSLTNIVNGGGGSATFGGIISLVFGGIILAAMVNGAASAWFNRPRY